MLDRTLWAALSGESMMRHAILRGFRAQTLIFVLALLASWGTVYSPTSTTAAITSPRLATSSTASELLPGSPERGITVVLDPGHNGASASHAAEINRPVPNGRGGTKPCNTTGTATNGGYPEHAFTWDVAVRVRDALTGRGVHVVLTRPNDAGIGPCVNDRAAIANRAAARAMVSIHADGAAPSGHGFHIAYSDPPLNDSQGPPSRALADALVKTMRKHGFTVANYIGSHGLYPRPDLAGLNLAQIPAALVECANMRNAQEAELVATPRGRAQYAAAIADGILAWLNSSVAASGNRRGP
ncbi:MAG TPA: N-acetylmuramoyl-L-alanine amidase [Pseudonocardiaceae bacterium]|jgi:N-acetylmuramoyl-L-alanine amidase|nr:N-acetylmuramoyl-L-alanine amidase [Pseudonocardiaceae bacterium]